MVTERTLKCIILASFISYIFVFCFSVTYFNNHCFEKWNVQTGLFNGMFAGAYFLSIKTF